MIVSQIGDLFLTPSTHSLAHCISADAHMSAGIALKFVSQFPILAKIRKEHNYIGTAKPVFVGGRFIYNLITKPNYWMKPTVFSLFSSLKSMLAHAESCRITDISIPKIGSGCDKLNFEMDVMLCLWF